MSGVEIAGLTVRMGDALLLDGVDLMVAEGEFLAIVGPNGSGKTTLLRAVSRAIRPSSGRVLIDGRDAAGLSAREAALRRAVVPQFPEGSGQLTVAEIVATGRYAHRPWWSTSGAADREAITDALRRTGAAPFAERPFGSLSGGERQRALLARALAQQASVLLLDEPTNHLDPRAQLDLLALVDSLPMTRIAVLHDLDHALAHADGIAVLHDGRVVAAGPPERVLSDDLMAEVFGLRARVIRHPLTGRPHLLTAALRGVPGPGGTRPSDGHREEGEGT